MTAATAATTTTAATAATTAAATRAFATTTSEHFGLIGYNVSLDKNIFEFVLIIYFIICSVRRFVHRSDKIKIDS
jgi:hypothetical protein